MFYLSVIKNEKFFHKNFSFWKKNYKKNIRNPFLKNEKYVLRNKNFRKHIFETNPDLYSLSTKKLFQILKKKILQKMF